MKFKGSFAHAIVSFCIDSRIGYWDVFAYTSVLLHCKSKVVLFNILNGINGNQVRSLMATPNNIRLHVTEASQ